MWNEVLTHTGGVNDAGDVLQGRFVLLFGLNSQGPEAGGSAGRDWALVLTVERESKYDDRYYCSV